jgi:hypothetical protein
VHISLARRFFDLDRPNIELVRADARSWVDSYRGAHFDLIIDDLFGDLDGVAHRNQPCDDIWLGKLAGMLSAHGVLATNLTDLGEFRRSAMGTAIASGSRWSSGYSLRLDTLENVVAILCGASTSLKDFGSAIESRFGARTASRCSIRKLPHAGTAGGRRAVRG